MRYGNTNLFRWHTYTDEEGHWFRLTNNWDLELHIDGPYDTEDKAWYEALKSAKSFAFGAYRTDVQLVLDIMQTGRCHHCTKRYDPMIGEVLLADLSFCSEHCAKPYMPKEE